MTDRLAELIHTSKSPVDRIHAAWILQRTRSLTFDQLGELVSKSSPRDIRVHVMKLLAERSASDRDFGLLDDGLNDSDPFVCRAAADTWGRQTRGVLLLNLFVELLQLTPADDSHLRQVVRMAMRNVVAASDDLSYLDERFISTHQQTKKPDPALDDVVAILLAVQKPQAAELLLSYLEQHVVSADRALPVVQHVARFAESRSSAKVAKLVRSRFADDAQQQLAFLASLRTGYQQRGQPIDGSLHEWATELAGKLLESSLGASLSWSNEAVPGKPKSDSPWVARARVSQDGDKASLFYDSLVKGEQLTGLFRSEPFELPTKLSFWCAGHNGLPSAPFNPKNYIRLRDASTHALLREALPPRNDTAQKIEWDLAEFVKGKQVGLETQPTARGYIELLDADEGSAYAWLAVGRFSVESLNPNHAVDQQIAAANLVADFKILDLKSQISERLLSRDTDSRAKEAFARTALSLEPDSTLSALAPLIAEASLPEALRDQIAATVVDRRLGTLARPKEETSNPPKADHPPLLVAVVQAIPERLQLRMAESLASDATGADALLLLAKEGHVSPRLLTRPTVKQRLDALKSETLTKQVADLTANLPDEDAALRKLIEQRRGVFLAAQSDADAAKRPSLDAGAALFTKHCAVCHQVAGKGTILGPQLDGIGQRGLERVLEDVLDPNRNVDVNFRTTTLVTKDGKIFSGLSRREEGATLVLADNKGKEFIVPLADIDERVKSNLSLMPANVAEIFNEREFLDLVSYLLSQRQKVEPK